MNSGEGKWRLRIGSSSQRNWLAASRPSFRATEIYARAATSATNILRAGGTGKQSWPQSHSSIHDAADCATALSWRSHAGFLPRTIRWNKYRQYSGVVNIARRVAQTGNLFRFFNPVWSFHNTNIAFGFSANSGRAPARYRRHQSVRASSRYCQRNPDHSCALFDAKLCKHGFQSASIDSM